jgi:tetrahydromethanopterin S-methyltransferase subunit C
LVDFIEVFNNMAADIINAIPAIIAAIIVILVGYFIGSLVGKAANRVVEKLGMEKVLNRR